MSIPEKSIFEGLFLTTTYFIIPNATVKYFWAQWYLIYFTFMSIKNLTINLVFTWYPMGMKMHISKSLEK